MNSDNTVLKIVQGKFKNLPVIDPRLRKPQIILPTFFTGSMFYAIVPELVQGQIGTATVFILTRYSKMVMFFVHATNSKGSSKRISASCYTKGQLQAARI